MSDQPVEPVEDYEEPVMAFENPFELPPKKEKKALATLDEMLKEREIL